MGSVVGIVNRKVTPHYVLMASWDGPDWLIHPEGMSWEEVEAQFFSKRTMHPEFTEEWLSPDFSKWKLYLLDLEDDREGKIYFYCFDRRPGKLEEHVKKWGPPVRSVSFRIPAPRVEIVDTPREGPDTAFTFGVYCPDPSVDGEDK